MDLSNIDFRDVITDQSNLSELNKDIKKFNWMIDNLTFIEHQNEFWIENMEERIARFDTRSIKFYSNVDKSKFVKIGHYEYISYIMNSRFDYFLNKSPILIQKGDPLYEWYITQLRRFLNNCLEERQNKKNKILAKYKEEVNTDEVHNNQQES